jgi:hypothetical protein
MDNINDESLFTLLKLELLDVFSDVKEVDIRSCQNDRYLCEYVTFRPYVWDRIGEDVRIFYSHFKGYISNAFMLGEYAYPKRNMFINECYWSYLMYRMSLDKEYIEEMKQSFDEGKDVYCWCLLDESNLEHIYIPDEGDYYSAFFGGIESFYPYIKERKYHYVCSQFVAAVLEMANVYQFDKPSKLVKPNDFNAIPDIAKIYEGKLKFLQLKFK